MRLRRLRTGMLLCQQLQKEFTLLFSSQLQQVISVWDEGSHMGTVHTCDNVLYHTVQRKSGQ
jgi:hypothetical protein